MLKKQTVWLLTMLSLMIVLSAYYLISDQNELAYINTNESYEEIKELEQSVAESMLNNEEEDVTTLRSSELFATIRMELEDKRSMKKERLKEIIASSEATANEVNEALKEIDQLEQLDMKEKLLQETIIANYANYKDVLVRAEDDYVHVHVITDQMPRSEAVQIMQLVRDELGEVVVDVNFQQE